MAAAKKAAKVLFVKGSRVKFTRRNGEEAKGFITKIDKTGLRGTWLHVETKEHGVLKTREGQAKKF